MARLRNGDYRLPGYAVQPGFGCEWASSTGFLAQRIILIRWHLASLRPPAILPHIRSPGYDAAFMTSKPSPRPASLREKAQLMSASEIERTLVRLVHEIVEKNNGAA